MTGALMQLIAHGAPDVFLTGNPEDGEPFWGYRPKCSLYSNPYCPTLEYTHLESGDLKKQPREKLKYTAYRDLGNNKITYLKKRSFQQAALDSETLDNKLKERLIDIFIDNGDNNEIDQSAVTNESIHQFKLEMENKC